MGNKPHHTAEGLNPLEVARVIRLGVKYAQTRNAKYERAADRIVEKAMARKAEQEAEREAARKTRRKGK